MDRIPPQAIKLEELVIGSILLEPKSLYLVRDKLFPEAFYKESHSIIYKTICSIDDKSEPVDLMTVQEELKKEKSLDEVGGVYKLTELSGKISNTANIEKYALILLEKYAKRKSIEVGHKLIDQSFDESKDINEILGYANSSFDKIYNSLTKGLSNKEFPEIIQQSIDEYYERESMAKEGKVSGIETPIYDLTQLTGGWQNGDLIIVAGRPSMGKTALALENLRKMMKNGYSPMLFSLEMPSARLADRIICGSADVNMSKYRKGLLNKEEKNKVEEAAYYLMQQGLTIDDKSITSMDYIRSRAIIKNKEGKCDAVFIDYGQLLDASSYKTQTREQEVAIDSRKAKALAKDLNIPVFFISQLNRGVEARTDKRPKLSDLRESGGIEQDADLVLLMYRPFYYGDGQEGEGEIICAKHRNGPIGTIKFAHNESLTRIYDYNETPF
jgi:replicative DNA helicase